MVATVPDVPDAFDFDTLGERLDTSPIGVLLLSVGSPETKEDVEEYLYNVFCDPEILTLPPAFSWALKQPIAAFIAKTEAPAAREIMESVGGLSPQKATIDQQALALKQELANRGVSSKLYVAMRYWTPFADEAVEQMKADGIQKLVILPLYPQFSLSTSGSSLRVLERMLYTDPGFPMESTVVPAWYNRRGFLRATARAVAEALAAVGQRVYVEELGDPYEEQVRRTVELGELGHAPKNTLSFQGQFGPQRVAWLGPSTSEVIGQLGADGVRTLVVVPISFVFEHMGTLNEIDREYASTAKQAGITTFVRVPTLGTDPSFIDTLASVVVEALPDLSRPSMQQINEGNPVSLSIVNECAPMTQLGAIFRRNSVLTRHRPARPGTRGCTRRTSCSSCRRSGRGASPSRRRSSTAASRWRRSRSRSRSPPTPRSRRSSPRTAPRGTWWATPPRRWATRCRSLRVKSSHNRRVKTWCARAAAAAPLGVSAAAHEQSSLRAAASWARRRGPAARARGYVSLYSRPASRSEWVSSSSDGKRPVSSFDQTGVPLYDISKAPVLISLPDITLQEKSTPNVSIAFSDMKLPTAGGSMPLPNMLSAIPPKKATCSSCAIAIRKSPGW